MGVPGTRHAHFFLQLTFTAESRGGARFECAAATEVRFGHARRSGRLPDIRKYNICIDDPEQHERTSVRREAGAVHYL